MNEAGTLPFVLPGEDDYITAMEGPCAQWRAGFVKAHTFRSFDGVKLCAYTAFPQHAKACIVMVHGYCEFFGKYHEMAWSFFRAGYATVFLEQRGHGHSGGKLAEPDIVYIDSFDTYVKDLEVFLEELVKPLAGEMPMLLFSHSMGGAVAALYLEAHPDTFRAALFSSPMFRLKSVDYSPPVLAAAKLYASLSGKGRLPAPGEKRFDGRADFENSSMLSRARYDYVFAQRVADVSYRTHASSLNWALAAMDAMHRLLKNAKKIRIPVTVFVAGNDSLVSGDGFAVFGKKVPQAEFFHYDASKHEIYNADEKTRKRYYSDVFRVLEQAL